MNFKRFLCLTISALLVGITSNSNLFAQQYQYQFELLDVRNGLSGNQVNSIFKDEKGFMWFGTLLGLSRYDGYNFKVFTHRRADTTSISDDYINVVTAGPHNTFCILTRNGWNVFDPRTEKFTTNVVAFLHTSKDRRTAIFKDKSNNFWYLKEGSGLIRYNPSSNKTTYYSTSSKSGKLFSNNVTSLAEDNAGSIWICYAEGVLEKLDVSKNSVVFRSNVLQPISNGQKFIYRLFADAEGDLWIYSSDIEKGIFYYKPASNYLLPINRDSKALRLNANLVGGISQDDNGNIWVATDHGGVNLINKKDFSIRYLVIMKTIARASAKKETYG